MKNVCFTGHRSIPTTEKEHLIQELTVLLERGISKGITEYYLGGAIGWDTLCADVVISLKKRGLNAHLHLILPCCNEEQTKQWSTVQKQHFYDILNQADTVEYVTDHYYYGCMKERNARLVAVADVCLCYYDTHNYGSGTGQTVRMAENKGIKVYNFKRK